jgi:hypothetical protein
MANHIENYIIIENSNEEVLKEVQRVFQVSEGEYDVHSEDLVKRVFGEDAPEEYDRGWYCDNAGAKWLYGSIEDDSEEEQSVRITSAWDPVNEWVERFAQNLQKIKEDVVVHNTFEDEGYNFAGVYFTSMHYMDTEWVDMDEYDVEKIWEDDDIREEYHDELHQILIDHKQSYEEHLEDMKENPEDYI